jgi:hypothetical protein
MCVTITEQNFSKVCFSYFSNTMNFVFPRNSSYLFGFQLTSVSLNGRRRDSSVVYLWATGWMMGVQVLVGAESFSRHHHVQTSSGAHPASYPMGKRVSFPGVRAALV